MSSSEKELDRTPDQAVQRERKIVYILLIGILLLGLVIWLERKSGLSWEDVAGSIAALMIILVTDILRWSLGHDESRATSSARGRADRLWVVALIGASVSAILMTKRWAANLLRAFQPAPAGVAALHADGRGEDDLQGARADTDPPAKKAAVVERFDERTVQCLTSGREPLHSMSRNDGGKAPYPSPPPGGTTVPTEDAAEERDSGGIGVEAPAYTPADVPSPQPVRDTGGWIRGKFLWIRRE